jgi:hypothetical protein
MWLFRLSQTKMRLRLEALRELYKRYFGENTAEARGLRLLREWLSPLQREQFDVKGNFEVIGSDTGRRYRVYYGKAMNVHELDKSGRLRKGWCFVPHGPLVAGDVMLAQKIALETFEGRALSVARRFEPYHISRDIPDS